MSTEENLDPYIEKKGMYYKCNLCALTLNGLAQVRSHVQGNNHNRLKLKVGKTHADSVHNMETDNTVFIQALSLTAATNTTESNFNQDPFIKMKGIGHECIICNVTLNSESQVLTHISGAKHAKAKSSYEGEVVSKVDLGSEIEFVTTFKGFQDIQEIRNTFKVIKVGEAVIFE